MITERTPSQSEIRTQVLGWEGGTLTRGMPQAEAAGLLT